MEGVLSDGMCRCCATEGSFKDFQVAYQWMGVEEIYGNMLKDCFDITLSVSEEISNGGICEVCITQLRNACNFKQQVQRTEEKFQKKLQEASFKTEGIKMEISRFEDDDSNISADDFSSPEYEVPIKVEKVEEKPKKRAAAKASTSKAKKTKASEGEPSVKRTEVEETSITPDEPQTGKSIITIFKKPKSEIKVVATKRGRYQADMKEILLNTNATPIRCKLGKGYACCFCTDQFPEPQDLKKHTLDEHDETTKSEFMRGVTLHNFNVKLDITDLKCNCGADLQNIDDLIRHLEVEHNKGVHANMVKQIIPFKFNDGLQCAICNHEFNNFKFLMEHMSVHYRNHVCQICGAAFVNKKTFKSHSDRHETGSFPCKVCSKVFDTKVKKMEHERAIHVYMSKRNKCGYCGEMFADYTKKQDHEVKVHGAKPVVLTCQGCDKIFDNQRALTAHFKTYHLMQRRKSGGKK
ncbi:zinc finger protein weckle-like isoform X27 [Maniola hyperantus]|uniref:zinc finger protein weckle-like isoform X27 n=1 Tax=Aphantopus hyperantus TaxID=2795564 RepID=UPI00156A11AA|nr:zinc finger protein weckle-like isoform X21 [Maniola hyperantus]